MNNGKLKAALIISLVFNFAVLGAFAFAWFRHEKPRRFRFVCTKECDHPVAERIQRLSKHVGLPQEKVQRIEEIMKESQDEASELKAELRKKRKELADLLHSDDPVEGDVMAKVDEISSLQGELEKLLVQRLLRVHSVLDRDERERFMKLIRRKMAPGHRKHLPHPGFVGDPGYRPPGKGGPI